MTIPTDAGWPRDHELVVLLDPSGRPIGSAPKATVHTDATPLHLAFSCHLLDDDGRMLVTRRALTKRAWPGVWTNACCGHPAPGEQLEAAVLRRVQQELGAAVVDLELVLPDFAYRAVDANGIVEHERCPVFIGRVAGELQPDPSETIEWQWVEPERLLAGIRATPWAFSPWLVLQAERMPLLAGAA
ncbi:isopentenyl-diphosphate Delta-isomerase [Agrococcus sp. ARC_14]|uniref:isopentenyl-diphosphate Delta-isomerase n=1 Tax=Agrococcus sp. ARC_14 TaxID=2919927 RepID=UPI001F060105|nr:isopentenyl-diphosphate Delta-isomerase [Agrococcus sp. ARC_14]MCH1881718.1 isopentenyl-diphosphate Delta-isomerase [Agrococcus sp. ARC_14]